MGILSNILGNRSLESTLEKARRLLAAGEFDQAKKSVEKALERWPDAIVLRETGHAIRRAQARAGIAELVGKIEDGGDPAAYEQLIALYRDVGMIAESVRLAERYVKEHPDLEAPHLLRGEQAIEDFFGDLRARDGRVAIDHLCKAGALHPDSLKPRMLLAEIYYAIGADKALLGQASAIDRLAGDDEVVRPVVSALREVDPPTGAESIDALLAKVEVSGQLVRDPSIWSSRKRKGIAGDADGARLARNLERLVRDESAEEAVAIDRSGAVLASAGEKSFTASSADSPAPDGSAPPATDVEAGLAGVARVVARTIKGQVRELEMGSFRRCVVEGPFGVMVVADAAGGVVAAKGRRGADPHRLAERIAVAVEGVRGRRS